MKTRRNCTCLVTVSGTAATAAMRTRQDVTAIPNQLRHGKPKECRGGFPLSNEMIQRPLRSHALALQNNPPCIRPRYRKAIATHVINCLQSERRRISLVCVPPNSLQSMGFLSRSCQQWMPQEARGASSQRTPGTNRQRIREVNRLSAHRSILV